MKQILLIEDDAAISRLVRMVLLGAGVRMTHAEDGESGLHQAESQRFDAVLLDLTLPGISGPEVLKALTFRGTTPVIVLTASDAQETLAECVRCGAFDVVRKPFDPEKLAACVQLAVGETPANATKQGPVKSGDLMLDFGAYRLTSQYANPGHTTQLSLSEWRILERLAATPGEVVLYQELLGRVWGPGFRGHVQFLQAWIERLSKKVPLSVSHGVGYALVV